MMPLHNYIKVNKVFYGKYPYKINLFLVDTYMFRKGFPGEVLKNLLVKNKHEFEKSLKFYNFLESHINDDIKTRFECNSATIYVKNYDLYTTLFNELEFDFDFVVYGPANQSELDFLSNDNNVIICNHLPFHRYRYKILFKEIPPENRISIATWLSKYKDDLIRVPKGFMYYLNRPSICWGTHYIYAIDQNMATLVTLASAGSVKRIQKYSIRDEINNMDTFLQGD